MYLEFGERHTSVSLMYVSSFFFFGIIALIYFLNIFNGSRKE